MMVASSTFRNNIRRFFLECIVPEGNGFTMDEMNGGTAIRAWPQDFMTAKYLYPDDPLVDFVFRNSFGGKGETFDGYGRNAVMYGAILAEKTHSPLSWREQLEKEIAPVMPLADWFPYRGLLVARSD